MIMIESNGGGDWGREVGEDIRFASATHMAGK